MKPNEIETHLVLCDCGSADHQVIFRYDSVYDETWMTITFHLGTWRNFLERLWRGTRYIFGHKSRFGDWDEVLLNPAGATELRDFLNEFIQGARSGK